RGHQGLDRTAQPRAAEALVVLRPADCAVVGDELEEREGPPPGIALVDLESLDLHRFLPFAGGAPLQWRVFVDYERRSRHWSGAPPASLYLYIRRLGDAAPAFRLLHHETREVGAALGFHPRPVLGPGLAHRLALQRRL